MKDQRCFDMATNITDTDGDRWDWSTVVTIVLGITVLLVLTLELWASHPFPNH